MRMPVIHCDGGLICERMAATVSKERQVLVAYETKCKLLFEVSSNVSSCRWCDIIGQKRGHIFLSCNTTTIERDPGILTLVRQTVVRNGKRAHRMQREKKTQTLDWWSAHNHVAYNLAIILLNLFNCVRLGQSHTWQHASTVFTTDRRFHTVQYMYDIARIETNWIISWIEQTQ
jgi:hypothetical protein